MSYSDKQYYRLQTAILMTLSVILTAVGRFELSRIDQSGWHPVGAYRTSIFVLLVAVAGAVTLLGAVGAIFFSIRAIRFEMEYRNPRKTIKDRHQLVVEARSKIKARQSRRSTVHAQQRDSSNDVAVVDLTQG